MIVGFFFGIIYTFTFPQLKHDVGDDAEEDDDDQKIEE